MSAAVELGPFNLRRIMQSISELEDRLHRFTSALNIAQIPYAVVGGNAVANWVSRVDPGAVRFTKDVDILMRRSDVSAAIEAVKPAGFRFRHAAGIDFFLDGEHGQFSSGVHLLMAGEKVRPDDLAPTPDVTESEAGDDYQVVNLEALVRMKLTSFRDHDRTHLRDLVRIGLVDNTWSRKFSSDLAMRLQQVLDTPNG